MKPLARLLHGLVIFSLALLPGLRAPQRAAALAEEGIAAAAPLDSDHVTERLKSAPLLFIENAGQFDDDARFQVRPAMGGTVRFQLHDTGTRTSTSQSSQLQQVFRDDFDGEILNSDLWQAYNNGGLIQVGSGFMSLSNPSATSAFPYVHTKFNPIPQSGDFAFRVGIQ